MATSKLKPVKPADPVAFEPVMIAVSKARAMAWTLERLGEADAVGNNLIPTRSEMPTIPRKSASGSTR